MGNNFSHGPCPWEAQFGGATFIRMVRPTIDIIDFFSIFPNVLSKKLNIPPVCTVSCMFQSELHILGGFLKQ